MPSFPITVSDSGTALQFFSPAGGNNPIFAQAVGFNGPFAVGNARYIMGGDADTGLVAAIKSTDFGVTWTVMDSANGPAPGAGSVSSVLDADGIRIWLVFAALSGTDLSIAVFDTATDTWSSTLDTIAVPPAGSPPINPVLNFVAAQDSDGNILVAGTFTVIEFTAGASTINFYHCQFILFDGAAWGSFVSFTAPPEVPGSDPPALSNILAVTQAGNFIHCFFAPGSVGDDSPPLYHQSVSGSSLGTLEAITGSSTLLNFNAGLGAVPVALGACFDPAGVITVSATGLGTPQDFTQFFVGSAANGANLGLSLVPFDPGLPAGRAIAGLFLLAFSTGVVYTFYIDFLADTDASMTFLINNSDPTVLGPVVLGSLTGCIQATLAASIDGFVLAFTGSQYYWEQQGVPPPPVVANTVKSVGGGATYFPRFFNKSFLVASIARIYGIDWVTLRDNLPLSSFFLFPNYADLCLSREFQLYNLIDREAMSCARKPECFLRSERDWQDSPPGWRAFNPVGVLSLPAPGDGDVVVLSFRVPYGYDGVITAQYHGYTNNFTQGSGDIVWRVRADGRYLRDMGDMEVAIGNPKQLSPVNGGLQLRSGNLVEYIVSAPNVTGTLPPGGNILAGLHGLFYPRL